MPPGADHAGGMTPLSDDANEKGPQEYPESLEGD